MSLMGFSNACLIPVFPEGLDYLKYSVMKVSFQLYDKRKTKI